MLDSPKKHILFSLTVAVGALVAAATFTPASGAHIAGNGHKTVPGAQLIIPMMSPERGKAFFVDKGCVACHAINGVGGHDAPAMDAHRDMGPVNPFDFAAKMWNHAPGMIAAQQEAFGEQIYFTGDELADIIAFLHNDEAQHHFSEADLTKKARKMMHHEHGGEAATDAHAAELGHSHE